MIKKYLICTYTIDCLDTKKLYLYKYRVVHNEDIVVVFYLDRLDDESKMNSEIL